MEQKILGLIYDKTKVRLFDRDTTTTGSLLKKQDYEIDATKAAKKITSHVMEFFKWLNWENNPISVEGDEEGNPIYSMHDDKFKRIGNFMDIEEVYQYWLTNIKK